MEDLQQRREFVDEYVNGIAYQNCKLSANGRYVVCP
jgi:hypothetical protein